MKSKHVNFICQMTLASSAMLLFSPFVFGKCETERKVMIEAHEQYDKNKGRCAEYSKHHDLWLEHEEYCKGLLASFAEKKAALEKCEAPPPRPKGNVTKEECNKAVGQRNSLHQEYVVCMNGGGSRGYCFDQACKSINHIEYVIGLCNSAGSVGNVEPHIPCTMVLPNKYGIPAP